MPHPSILVRIAILIAALVATGGASRAEDARPAWAELALTLADDGTLLATGTLPRDLSPEALSAALPDLDVSGAEPAVAGAPWRAGLALDALAIVLPRFRAATVRLGEGRLAIKGELKSGLSAAGVQAALRAALGTGWRLDLALGEVAPVAEIVLHKAGEDVSVSGLLPDGLDAPEALKLIGPRAGDVGLAGGGDGGAQDWSGALAALGATLDLVASATVRVTTGEVAIEGVLRPGYPRGPVAERLAARLPAGWRARLEAEETPPSEGDRRVSLTTGTPESFRRGWWLPEVAFPVSTERCRAESDALLGGDGLPFVDGAALVEERGLPLVNRLAAIAIRCLNSSALRLDIGGHTDSVGNDARNMTLSQARAEAVRQALLDRGVRAEAVTARGYGESRPVATNDTPDGRAQNRRIVLDWSSPEG